MKRANIFLLQGIYYLITGLWPIIDIHSFMLVTGPKTDIWLVKMVGLLTVAIAITLLRHRSSGDKSLLTIAVTGALSYLLIDVYYVARGTIPAIYLGDAVVELVIIALLLFSLKRNKR